MNSSLPFTTIIVEWENAIDVEDKWADRALVSLQAELKACHNQFEKIPRVMYLFNENAVSQDQIEKRISHAAPELARLAMLEFIATPDLTYYKLKNYGATLSQTDVTIFLDSDAGPNQGWLAAMLKPFQDEKTMVVAGFTTLGYEDLLSRTMALSWIMRLPSERLIKRDRHKMYANNCAMRTPFLKCNPFPDLKSFKKQCGFWQTAVEQKGVKIHYAPDAITTHAPHPGGSFLVWRAWTTGMDRDFKTVNKISTSRIARFGLAFAWWAGKVARSWQRIILKGAEVGLPIWQRPAAMAISLAYFSVMLSGQLTSAATRSVKSVTTSAKA